MFLIIVKILGYYLTDSLFMFYVLISYPLIYPVHLFLVCAGRGPEDVTDSFNCPNTALLLISGWECKEMDWIVSGGVGDFLFTTTKVSFWIASNHRTFLTRESWRTVSSYIDST